MRMPLQDILSPAENSTDFFVLKHYLFLSFFSGPLNLTIKSFPICSISYSKGRIKKERRLCMYVKLIIDPLKCTFEGAIMPAQRGSFVARTTRQKTGLWEAAACAEMSSASAAACNCASLWLSSRRRRRMRAFLGWTGGEFRFFRGAPQSFLGTTNPGITTTFSSSPRNRRARTKPSRIFA